MPNRLARSQSLYLRKHADNPIDWYPWDDEALEKARNENKPIFLSIGYSSCHWCTVMEHEAFSDTVIADYMNERFVAIKVDRAVVRDRGMLRTLESDWAAEGIERRQTAQGIIYRIPRA